VGIPGAEGTAAAQERVRGEEPAAARDETPALTALFGDVRGEEWTDDMPSVAEAPVPVAAVEPEPDLPEPEEEPDPAPVSASRPQPEDDGDDEMTRVDEIAAARATTAENQTAGVLLNEIAGVTTLAGAQITSAALTAAGATAAQNETEKKNERDRSLLMRLNAQIAALQDEIDAINARLAEIDTRMDEIDGRLGELSEAEAALDDLETMNPGDPRYDATLRRAGLTGEQVEREGKDAALRRRRNEIEQERTGLTGEQAELADEQDALRERKDDAQRSLNELQSRAAEIDELERTGAISTAEADSRRAEILDQSLQERDDYMAATMELWANQVDQEAGPTPELTALVAETIDTRASADEEIGAFMRDLAQAQEIEDPMARLAREKELVDGLSEDAAFDLEVVPEAQALFEEGYFDALDEAPGADGESGRIPVSAPAP
jgi:prefoldin subunit 5